MKILEGQLELELDGRKTVCVYVRLRMGVAVEAKSFS